MILRQTVLSIFLFALSSMIASCDPCRNLDCISDNLLGQFRIVSKTDGKDLVFGPHAVYDPAKIKFYSLNGTDTIFFQYRPTSFRGTGSDSILSVRFFPIPTTAAYMILNNADTDTLTITSTTFTTKCCGTITDIVKFRHNNNPDIPGNKGVQEIDK